VSLKKQAYDLLRYEIQIPDNLTVIEGIIAAVRYKPNALKLFLKREQVDVVERAAHNILEKTIRQLNEDTSLRHDTTL
jgi:hypothetical protein